MTATEDSSNIRIKRPFARANGVITPGKAASAMDRPQGVTCSDWHPCQVFAIAERDGKLSESDEKLWRSISASCNEGCAFNKIGRENRSLDSKRAVNEQAVQMDMEAVRANGRDWTTCT